MSQVLFDLGLLSSSWTYLLETMVKLSVEVQLVKSGFGGHSVYSANGTAELGSFLLSLLEGLTISTFFIVESLKKYTPQK